MAAAKSGDRQIWFPAKRYGWGWGLPVKWQGWAVLIVWIGFVALAGAWLMPHRPVAFSVVLALLTVAIVAICYQKGERLQRRWRHGRKYR